jgi:hypothetical protein
MLIAGVTLLALVLWSIISLVAPSPTGSAGSWAGAGSIDDTSGGGANRVAVLLRLRDAGAQHVTGTAQECNDRGQVASFVVMGTVADATVTRDRSGATVRGHSSRDHLTLAGGTSMQRDVRRDGESQFVTVGATGSPTVAPTVP